MVIPNLLKLVNSPSLANPKDIDSLLEDEEMAEAKNAPDTRKKHLIIRETGGSITKKDLFRRHGLRCVC